MATGSCGDSYRRRAIAQVANPATPATAGKWRSCICHPYENSRRGWVFFPFRNRASRLPRPRVTSLLPFSSVCYNRRNWLPHFNFDGGTRMHCCVLSLHALNCRARNHRVSTRRALITFSLALALAISTLAPSEAAFAQEHAGHGAGAAKPAAVLMSGYGNWHHPVSTKNAQARSEEHTSELQSPYDLVCRLLLEKKKETL